MRTEVLGVGFDAVTMDEAVSRALDWMKSRAGAVVCTPNPEIVWACRKDGALRAAINGADLVLPDGVGILRGAAILGRSLPERVAGVDFCRALLGEMEGTVFLLGGKPGVARKAAENLSREYPRITVCGAADGYFKEDGSVIREISASAPDLLLVCLGSPKQEFFMAKNHGALNAGVMAGLGGSMDVLAGNVKRAPDWWIGRNLEWLYRLLQEPKRIKRQAVLPLYLMAVTAERLKHG
jgi:bacterial polymer biosynthesis proteins, WecB/TagA/CpsF family